MFGALFLAGLIVIAVIGGKTALLFLVSLPLIGPVAAWYMGYIGQIGDGVVANLIYGSMALQLVIMAFAPLLYGPLLVHKAVACWHRARRVGARN